MLSKEAPCTTTIALVDLDKAEMLFSRQLHAGLWFRLYEFWNRLQDYLPVPHLQGTVYSTTIGSFKALLGVSGNRSV